MYILYIYYAHSMHSIDNKYILYNNINISDILYVYY